MSTIVDHDAARQAELARLIAEQEADDTDRISQQGLSLDADLTDGDGFSLHDVLTVEERLESTPAMKVRGRVTAEQRKEWRHLRNKQGWTYQQIADYAGCTVQTVRYHLIDPRAIQARRLANRGWTQSEIGERFGVSQPTVSLWISGKHRKTLRRAAPRRFELMQRKAYIREAYEAGARIIDIAEVLYRECGYASPESCYQVLRRLMRELKIPVRPRSWKHGGRSSGATEEQYRAYLKRQNRKARQRYRKKERVVSRKWTPDAVRFAIRRWEQINGRPPKTSEWRKASATHPTNVTVTNLFGSWPEAIRAAGFSDYRGRSETARVRTAQMVELRREGMTYKQIAARLGTTVPAVMGVLSRAGSIEKRAA